jgi:Tol biopolymer transport system component
VLQTKPRKIMIRLYQWALIGSLLAVNACDEPDATPTVIVAGPEDVTSFDAVGSGKLGFQRDGKFFIVDADARSTWGLTSFYGSALSPDGKYIAFVSPYKYDSPTEILLYEIESELITEGSREKWSCGNPSWTADSNNLLFEMSINTSQTFQLVRQSIDGETKSTIASWGYGVDFFSSISASVSDKLVFTYMKAEVGKTVSGIFTMNLDGSELTQLTPHSDKYADSPAWSPDGKSIAYISSQFESSANTLFIKQIDIIIADSDGGNPAAITSYKPVGVYAGGPLGVDPSLTWSPNGERLAFTLPEADGFHIYTIKADGSDMVKLTSKAGTYDDNLSWSR